jgi:L-seryl-tRNA(Ser) seleniumtransferase
MRYEELGVKPLINAFDTITTIGGSRMEIEVMEAMTEASKSFVDLHKLLEKAGARIALRTRNEAAFITAGAASGLMLAASACITGKDPDRISRLPDTEGMANEIIVHKCQRISWDRCVRQSGARLIEIGDADQACLSDLEGAYTDKTAAVLYYASSWYEANALPLEQVIASARQHQVPVIVDAAANLPPVENLWHYTQLGADLVIFSGGKGLGGPQCTGLILGKAELIEACRLNGNPCSAIGRVAKVGKEEIMGLLTAVERYLDRDHEVDLAQREQWVSYLIEQLDAPGVVVSRIFPGPHGQSYPRVQIRFPAADKCQAVVRALSAGEPMILVGTYPHDRHTLFINPLTLVEEEVHIIAARMKVLLTENT